MTFHSQYLRKSHKAEFHWMPPNSVDLIYNKCSLYYRVISSLGWKGYFTTLSQHWYYCWYQMNGKWYIRFEEIGGLRQRLPSSPFYVCVFVWSAISEYPLVGYANKPCLEYMTKLFLATFSVFCPLRLILQACKPRISGSRIIIQPTFHVWMPMISGESSRISFNRGHTALHMLLGRN